MTKVLNQGNELIEKAQAVLSKSFMKDAFEQKCFNECCFKFGGGAGIEKDLGENKMVFLRTPYPIHFH